VLDPKPGTCLSASTCWSARTHRVPCRHHRQRAAQRRGPGDHRQRKPPPSPGGWGMNRALPSCPSRPSATRRAAGSIRSARRSPSSTSAIRASNTKAIWPPMPRSTHDHEELSVQPPDRPGQRADHAGAAIGQHLGQAAARTGGKATIGPMLIGMEKPVQIAPQLGNISMPRWFTAITLPALSNCTCNMVCAVGRGLRNASCLVSRA
jgi:hypothetical protein